MPGRGLLPDGGFSVLEVDLSDLSLCYSRNPDPLSQASGREETSTKHCLRVALGCSQQTSACSSWEWTNFLDKWPWGPKGQIEGPGRKDRRLLGLKEGAFGEEVEDCGEPSGLFQPQFHSQPTPVLWPCSPVPTPSGSSGLGRVRL